MGPTVRKAPWFFILAVTLAAMPGTAQSGEARAILAGGCFWCTEADLEGLPGVISAVSGYVGGKGDNPTYASHVASGHREAVEVTFDPDRISYARLLHVFLRSIDPTDGRGQFCDRGHSYTTAIHALDDGQHATARHALVEAGATLGREPRTELLGPAAFWPAEDEHQDFATRNPAKYIFYRASCFRDRTLKRVWGAEALEGIAK